MIATLQQVLERALDTLVRQVTLYLPPLLAGLTILLAAYLLARLARWLIIRTFTGAALDRFLRDTGLTSILVRTRGIESARVVAHTVYWGILIAGLLTALNAFDTQLTSRMVEAVVLAFPKLATAALILLAGAWLAQYLGRTVLVWACNEDLPHPRRWTAAVRTAIGLISVVVAADMLNFARNVFLAAFIILAGGAVLAASLALGLGGRAAAERYFLHHDTDAAGASDEALWKHL